VLKGFNYNGRPLGCVGSLVAGMRGPHKGRTAFNLNDFDVDLYVVHPEEWDKVRPAMLRDAPESVKSDKIFPNPLFTPDLSRLGSAVGKALEERFKGRLKSTARLAETEILIRRENPW